MPYQHCPSFDVLLCTIRYSMCACKLCKASTQTCVQIHLCLGSNLLSMHADQGAATKEKGSIEQ